MVADEADKHEIRVPADTVSEPVDRIILAKHRVDDAPLSPAWREEIRRRVDDIRSGREPGIAGEEVMARARKLVGPQA